MGNRFFDQSGYVCVNALQGLGNMQSVGRGKYHAVRFDFVEKGCQIRVLSNAKGCQVVGRDRHWINDCNQFARLTRLHQFDVAATDQANTGHGDSDFGHCLIFTGFIFVFLMSITASSDTVRIKTTIPSEGHNWLKWNIRILYY
ncbi:hypothetical protein [Pseudomonas sp. 22 E 5]|nr:hypothetical protein [Pseudomonas sp. 22 E 5]